MEVINVIPVHEVNFKTVNPEVNTISISNDTSFEDKMVLIDLGKTSISIEFEALEKAVRNIRNSFND